MTYIYVWLSSQILTNNDIYILNYNHSFFYFICVVIAIGQPTLFGQPQQQQPQQQAGLFGKPALGFPTTTTQSTSFGFGQPSTAQPSNIFGAQPAKSFGTTPSIFGATASSQPSTAFGTTPASGGFTSFGAPQQVHTMIRLIPKPIYFGKKVFMNKVNVNLIY